MKKHGDSMVGVIVTSNRCELKPIENLFSRGSLRLGRWETLAPTGTTITTTMKTSLWFVVRPKAFSFIYAQTLHRQN